ncbi:MAG: AAA family ATPase [Acidimicrobiales bacterium]
MRQVGRGTNERGSILIVTGPAASGKTSVARVLAERSSEPSVHLQGDDFFRALKTGRRRGWEPGAEPQHEVVFEAIARAATVYARGGYFVVVDSLIRPPYLHILTDVIASDDIELHYVALRPQLTAVQSRSGQRDESSRHDENVLDFLYRAFSDLGELESHVLDNSALDVESTVAEIGARLTNGTLAL